MIRALPEDVRSHLRSGVAITSVAQCVEELLLNSADAQATCIAVRVDLETFKVQVVDNGCGLRPEDMERAGIRYFTSKCHSVDDLENLRYYGFRGEAIASMVDASSVVEICSRHKDTGQTFHRLFQNGKLLDVTEAETPRPAAGTTVTLYNLFFNLPVRRKHLEPVLELERIRQRVEAVSLVKPSVSFSLRNDAARCVLLQLPKTKDPCSRFCQIFGPSRGQSLREVRHTHGGFTMEGLISCEGHYNKAMQFLYVNHRLVLKTKLHKLIDFIIRRESAICRGRSGRPRSTANLHGIFVVNIQCRASEYDICLQPDKTLIEFQDWDKVMLCAERGLRGFLKRENLFLEPSRDDVDEFCQKHHYNLLCEGDPSGGTPVPSDSANRGSPLKEDEMNINSRDGADTQEDRMLCDMKDVADNGSPLTPLDRAGVSRALSCAESGALNEKTPSSVPQNPVSTSTGSEHVERGISSSAYFRVPLSTPARLEGTLERFIRLYGKSCLVSRDCRNPKLPKDSSDSANRGSPLKEDERLPGDVPETNFSSRDGADTQEDRILCDMKDVADKGSPLTPPDRAGVSSALPCADSGALNKKTPSSVPPNLVSISIGSEHVGTGIINSAGFGVLQRCSTGPKPIRLRAPAHLGGTLERFRRQYGKSSLVSRDCPKPQLPKAPGRTAAIHPNPCAGTDVPTERNQAPESTAPTTNPMRKPPTVSEDAECAPTLTTKLRRLKNNMGDTSLNGGCNLAPSTPPSSNISEDGGIQSPQEQHSELNHGGPACEDPPDGPASHEWLQCYEESLGKNVFINTATGLSSYSAPARDKAVVCTKDLSNMAVTVVCGNDNGALSSLYTEWKNPVYVRHPSLAVDVSREHCDALSVKIHNILYPYRFTKEMVHSVKVLQQVDQKFIACLMNSEGGQTADPGGHLLVLVDQHAAHERVRLEQLIADSFETPSETHERRLKVSAVDPALEVHVSEEEYRVLRTRAGSLRRVGLSLTFPDPGSPRVLVSEIPLCFLEREANETQRGRAPVVKKMVEEYLQEQVQLLQVPGAGHGAVPGTVLKVLASQACHGAVKFNHPLSVDECRHLMHSLAQCSLPFQCAHGRPSILPLADLQHMEPEDPPVPNLRRLRRLHRAWQLYEKGVSDV